MLYMISKEVMVMSDISYRSRVGIVMEMKCGMWATIIEYKDSRHVRIRFDDGYEVWCKYGNFIEGNVKYYPNCMSEAYRDRFGNDMVVIWQDKNALRAMDIKTGKIVETTVKEFIKRMKISKYVDMSYTSIDGFVYRIIKVYDVARKKKKQCDIAFADGLYRQADLSNAIQGKIRRYQLRRTIKER